MTIQKVALIGANGHLGPSVLHALLSSTSPKLSITVISRKSSKSTYPTEVNVVHISDNSPPPHEELINVFTGQDAVVTTFAGTQGDLQIRLADAAAEAGVKRFIPADFGSCDSSDPRSLDLVPLYREKEKVRKYLQKLATSSAANGQREDAFSWTSLVCGHFFDYGLESGLLAFDIAARKATVFDGGDIKFSASTLGFIGRATAEILTHRENETRNKMLYIQSFATTQNEVLGLLEKYTEQKWTVEQVDSEKYIDTQKKKLNENSGDHDIIESLVSVEGIVNANWTAKENFANGLLGLQQEDLEGVIRGVVSR